MKRIKNALAAAAVVSASVLEFDSVEAIKQCAARGMGLAVLALITLGAELAEGTLVALSWSGQDLTMTTQVVWHKKKWISPVKAAFLAVAREHIRKRGVASQTR